MPSLTDLINPTFLMFLGILVLAVALLVVYFESKFREQNHKISSMLSLVSSLAEEVNGSKMIIHQLTMNRQPQNPQFFQQQQQQPSLDKSFTQNDNLILVSDDEEDASDSDSDYDSDSDAIESVSGGDAASEVSIDENILDEDDESVSSVIEIGDNKNDVKILKLNVNNNKDDSESGDDLSEASLEDLEEMDDLEELEDLDDSSTSSVSDKEEKNDNVKSMDFKSINITLEETKPEQPLDYKKMALPKLRSIVADKGLSTDSSKLKKNELLKLLGVE
jgi:hypothetical protein